MTQENKELLLRDLCARLPYGVKFQSENIETALFVDTSDDEVWINGTCIDDFKPYLFPLSSMTKEQYDEYTDMGYSVTERGWSMANYHQINWLNKNHFDYHGLIPMGLANDATGLNIY